MMPFQELGSKRSAVRHGNTAARAHMRHRSRIRPAVARQRAGDLETGLCAAKDEEPRREKNVPDHGQTIDTLVQVG